MSQPSARVPAARVAEQRDGGVGDDARAVVLAAVEHHLREHGEVGRGAEQPGVAGDAAERVGVLVVHFAAAADSRAAELISVGAMRARSESAGRKNVSVMPSGVHTRSCRNWSSGSPDAGLDDEAEHVGAEVGVLVAPAGLAAERRRDDRGARFFGRVRDAPEVAAGGQSRAVLEQHADGDAILVAAGELGHVLRDGVVEVDLALVEQDHDRGRGADDLGQRREIVDRAIGGDRRARLFPAEPAEALLPDGGAATSDDDRGARDSRRP